MSTKTNLTNTGFSLIHNWLHKASANGLDWLDCKLEEISKTANKRTLFTSYSAVPRYLGKEKLNISEKDLQAARLVTGWNPVNLTTGMAGRILLLLSFPSEESDRYVATLEQIIAAADVEETIAFYRSLPLLPHPERFKLRAAEGIRTNMTSVFNAVALNNPYPAQYLDELAWNQMVLKALFVGSPLHPIYGLKTRNNLQLSQMLINYARERLAANRSVSPELWELAMPFKPEIVAELKSRSKLRYN